MKLIGFALTAAVVSVLLLSACSTSGGTAGSSGGESNSGSGGTSSAPTAKVTGDVTGTIEPNNCASSGAMAIFVVVGKTKYLGTLTATEASFVGPAAVEFASATDKDPALPTISSDGNTFTLSSVHVYDLIGGKSAVMDGKITCP